MPRRHPSDDDAVPPEAAHLHADSGSAYSPVAQIRQVGEIADGLGRLTGWRRTAVRFIVVGILLLFLFIVMMNLIA